MKKYNKPFVTIVSLTDPLLFGINKCSKKKKLQISTLQKAFGMNNLSNY